MNTAKLITPATLAAAAVAAATLFSAAGALAQEANRRSGIAALVESPVGNYSKLSPNNT